MGWEQIGLGMGGYNPFASLGIGAAPSAGATSGLGLSSLTSTPWYMPQLAGGAGGLFQLAAVPGALNDLFTYRDPNQGWLAGGLSGALQGMGAGSMFGPVGAGVGAGAGYMSGKK